jgi:uncharacterized protein (TIGR03437 family)
MKLPFLRTPKVIIALFTLTLVVGLLFIRSSSAQPQRQTATRDVKAELRARLLKYRAQRDQRRVERLLGQTQATKPSARELFPGSQPEGKGEAKGERPDHPGEAAEFFLRKRAVEGADQLPLERYLTAFEQMRRMPQSSLAEGRVYPARAELSVEQQRLSAWTPLGPGNIGGRTRALLIDPQNPQTMFAAGVSGGVWKSVNGGQSWQPVADLLANIAVNSLAFDPRDPNVIYAGTGEGIIGGLVAIKGLGIFKTTDGGTSWARLEATANENFDAVSDIVISPHDSRRIYAATYRGVFRSLDGGASWTMVLESEPPYPFSQGGCKDLAIRTDRAGDDLLAACSKPEQNVIWHNTDAAGNGGWKQVWGAVGFGRIALAIAPSNQNVSYAVVSALYSQALYGVYRSNDGGEEWGGLAGEGSESKLARALLSFPPLAFSSECGYGLRDSFGGQAFYDMAVAVDPVDENRVWVGGIDLFRSDDGGWNWGLAGFVYVGPNFNLGAIHPDQHTIVFHPQYNGTINQVMYVGNDGGLYRTDNARAVVATSENAPCNANNSAVKWTALNHGYAVTQFYHGAVFPDGKSYFGGTQDNGTLLGTDATGLNGWRMINGGDGGYVAVDPTNTTTLYSEFTGLSIQKSTDGGKTFGFAVNGIDFDPGTFISPYVMDPSDPQRLYAGGYNVWRTTNGAASWQSVGQLAPFDSVVAALAVTALAIAPTDANYALIATANFFNESYIVRTNRMLARDESSALEAPAEVAAQPREGYVSWVEFDPANKNVAYATYSTFGGEHVWRTTDAGVSWTSIDGQGAGRLPDVPVHCIKVDPSNTARLYLGTDVGVFVSNDGGATWAVENTGFANVITEALALNVVNGVTQLYAFTHGRGAWRVTANLSGCNYALSSTGAAFAATGGQGSVTVNAAPGGCAWTAASNADWISAEQRGGTVNFTVAPNRTVIRRFGTLTLAGRSFTITQEGLPDLVPPTVEIVTPPTSTFNTTVGAITLRGMAADNGELLAVLWTNERGGIGLAEGKASWVADVALFAGRNVISVQAYDKARNIGTATITIHAMPDKVYSTVIGDGAESVYPAKMIFDGAGNLYFGDLYTGRVLKAAPDGTLTTVAGGGRTEIGDLSIPAAEARITAPAALAIDQQGNLFIADRAACRVLMVSAADGMVSRVAGLGCGFTDIPRARFASIGAIEGIAVDRAGDLYIADRSNLRIRKVNVSEGLISTVAGIGQVGSGGDGGPATAAQLCDPTGVVVDDRGDIYICDSCNNRIRKVSSRDGTISTVAGTITRGFSGDGGPATSATMDGPFDLALDAAHNLYIADTFNLRVRRVAADTGIITTFAGNGSFGYTRGGTSAAGPLAYPSGIAVDSMGIVHLTENGSLAIRKIVSARSSDTAPPLLRITTPTTSPNYTAPNSPLALSGTVTDEGPIVQMRWINDRGGGGEAELTTLWKIPVVPLQPGLNNLTVTAWDANGNAGSTSVAVNFTSQQTIITLAGSSTIGNAIGNGGPATAATLLSPQAVAVDATGNVYVAETSGQRVRKILPNGVITAFAGTGALGSSGDGGPATAATLNTPIGLAIDAAGNVYIADTQNNRVRRVNPAGVITTVAGTGRVGSSGDGGPATAAELDTPGGVAVDVAGNLYITELYGCRVRKVAAGTGVITTVAGNGRREYGGDGGPATAAALAYPLGVAVDVRGNLYMSEYSRSGRVRRVNAADGTISTIAGTGEAGFNGDGGPAKAARLNAPALLAVDAAGDLYIADLFNYRVRKITLSDGLITTVAGNGTLVMAGDGGSPTGAALAPFGVAVDRAGNLYIADPGFGRVRKTLPAAAVGTVAAVSAASFVASTGLAAEAIGSAFGTNFTTAPQSAQTIPLPTTLAGVAVKVIDNIGAERLAPLFFVSPSQINFLVPNGLASGLANLTITTSTGQTANGVVKIAPVAPGLFAANGNGQGLAAAVALRVKADGAISYEPIVRYDPAQNRLVAVPIELGPDLGNASDQVFLLLFGTGVRGRSALSAVSVKIGSLDAPVSFAGAQGELVGVDQLNARLPRSLAGRGEVEVLLTVDGQVANAVRVSIK